MSRKAAVALFGAEESFTRGIGQQFGYTGNMAEYTHQAERILLVGSDTLH